MAGSKTASIKATTIVQTHCEQSDTNFVDEPVRMCVLCHLWTVVDLLELFITFVVGIVVVSVNNLSLNKQTICSHFMPFLGLPLDPELRTQNREEEPLKWLHHTIAHETKMSSV